MAAVSTTMTYLMSGLFILSGNWSLPTMSRNVSAIIKMRIFLNVRSSGNCSSEIRYWYRTSNRMAMQQMPISISAMLCIYILGFLKDNTSWR